MAIVLVNRHRAHWLALLLPLALLGGAMGSQYFGGLHPCEMCYWQRWPHAAAIIFAILGFADKGRAGLWLLLAALAIATSGAIGIFHAGVEQKWWEGLTRCTSGGGLSLEEILATPLVRCDQIQWQFLGLSMAAWNGLLSLGGALLILIGWRRS